MECREEFDEDERRQGRFERAEPSSGELVAQRLQDEMRSALESIRSGPWAPPPRED